MVDSCSRENGALCTVARSWLLFLHDKSERKIVIQILLEVLMDRTKHFEALEALSPRVTSCLIDMQC